MSILYQKYIKNEDFHVLLLESEVEGLGRGRGWGGLTNTKDVWKCHMETYFLNYIWAYMYIIKYMRVHVKDFNGGYPVQGIMFLQEVTDYQVKISVLGVGHFLSICHLCPGESQNNWGYFHHSWLSTRTWW